MKIGVICTGPNERNTWKEFYNFCKSIGVNLENFNIDIYDYFPYETKIGTDKEIDFNRYKYLIIFNDINLLAEIIDFYRKTNKNLRILFIQEGSTDFKFKARKTYNIISLKNIYKIYKYLKIGTKNLGFSPTLYIFYKYFSKSKKNPYGFGIHKDILIFRNYLEYSNFVSKIKNRNTNCQLFYLYSVRIIKQEKYISPKNYSNALIIHQPLYERYGFKNYLLYYKNLIKMCKKRFKNVFIKLHPRSGNHKKYFRKYNIKFLNTEETLDNLKNNTIVIGHSSTLLFHLYKKGFVVFPYWYNPYEPDNISAKFIRDEMKNDLLKFFSSDSKYKYTFANIIEEPSKDIKNFLSSFVNV